jgi:hypothetical protein
MLSPMRTMWFMAMAAGLALLAGGCATQNTGTTGGADALTASGATLHLEPGKFATAFDQSRDVLRDLGFILDRVDGQLGVITTQPKGTGGIMTPWDQEQSGFDDRLEDAVERHRRVVRIEFAPAGLEPGSAEIRDMRAEQRPIDARVTVTIYRAHQPGWRLNPLAVLDSTYTHDPQLDERGMGLYTVAVRQDDELAHRIVERVQERLDRQTAAR